MTDLEQRVRESLRSRSGDVEATPALWAEVERRVRRERWRTTWMWAGGAAAAAAAVLVAVVGPNLLEDRPQEVTVDPLPSEQPSRPDDEQPTEAPTGAPATSPTHVVAASQKEITLRTLDGQVVDSIVSYGDEFEGSILSVAVRPGSTLDDLTVAFTVQVEGDVEVRLVRRGEAPETIDLSHQGWDGLLAPRAVWSLDGSHLYWIDATDGEVVLRSGPWTDEGLGSSTSLGNVDGLDQFQLQDATPDRRLLSVTTGLQARALVVASGRLTDVEQVSTTGARAVLDLSHVGPGQYDLTVGCPDVPEGQGDAECAVFQLTYADGETPEGRELPLPDVMTAGTASPYGAWLAAEQDTAVVGWGGLAWLVTLEGELTELPGETVAADLVLGARASAEAPPIEAGSPEVVPTATEDDVNDPPGGIGPIPGGAYVVVTPEAIELVYDRGSRQTLLSWPGGEAAEFRPSRVSVRPGSAPDDLTVVVLTAGEGETELGWIDVRGGQVGEYEPFPAQYQMSRPLDGGSVGVPVWSPDGAYLAWIEEAAAADVGAGAFSLRVIGWDGGPGTGRTADDNTSFTVDEFSGGDDNDLVLDQWIWNSDTDGMLTFRYLRDQEFGTASLAIARQPDGAITYGGDVAFSDGRFDEALTDEAVYSLLVEGETLLGIQRAGDTSMVPLPDGYRDDLLTQMPPAAGPWLDVAHGGAVLFSADQRAWHVGLDGTLTELGRGFRDLDPVR